MIAKELITEDLPPLLAEESVDKAITWMDEFRVNHFPVIDHGKLIGIISDNICLDVDDTSSNLKSIEPHLIKVLVMESAHIYEVMKLMAEYNLTVIPVIDNEENYVGCIQLMYLMKLITNIASIKENGGVLVIELNNNDYSLVEISQIVESNNARILSSYITSAQDSTKLEITLKINQVDLSRIIKTFERYDYFVKATYQKSSYEEDLSKRYEEFIKYLNM